MWKRILLFSLVFLVSILLTSSAEGDWTVDVDNNPTDNLWTVDVTASTFLDQFCNTDNKILKRLAGKWVCADDAVGTGGSGNATMNYTNVMMVNQTNVVTVDFKIHEPTAKVEILFEGGGDDYS